MVMQKRLEYGFNGYQVPAMPRAMRSARGKGSSRKKFCGKQMCAFELLATVAGKLLCENEILPINCDSSAGKTIESTKQSKDGEAHYMKTVGQTPTCLDGSLSISRESIKQKMHHDERLLEGCDQGSSDEGPRASCGGLHCQLSQVQNYTLEEDLHAHNDDTSGSASIITKCDSSAQTACYGNSGFEVGSNQSGGSSGAQERCELEAAMLQEKLDENKGYHGSMRCELKRGNEIGGRMEDSKQRVRGLLEQPTPDSCSSEEPMDVEAKPPALVSSDSSDEAPLFVGCLPCCSLPVCREDKSFSKDNDDDNSCGFSQPSNMSLKSYRPPHLGEGRIRKIISPLLRKVSPTVLKDGNPSNKDVEKKLTFCNKKANYKRQRTQRFLPGKRRLFQQRSVLTSDGVYSEGVSDAPVKCVCSKNPGLAARMKQGNGASSPVKNLMSSIKGNDAKVTLCIKSFKVPELFIEMPETATVGTLKRAVMEAVTSMLGSGLRVSILLQGRKVHDDTKTLLQTGFPCSSKLDDVGFFIEPNSVHAPKPTSTDPCPPPSPKETQLLNRFDAVSDNSDVVENPLGGLNGLAGVGPIRPGNGSWGKSNHDQITSADLSPEEETPNSRALIALPGMGTLAVVPLHRKPRRSELVQRRIRRPYSVSEVEALVKAVEKLGTGRWRDVKLLAFDNAKHRTYVDLKDKWKTLVHTARISPQQRRGEPVPQELLDRVLSVHAHW